MTDCATLCAEKTDLESTIIDDQSTITVINAELAAANTQLSNDNAALTTVEMAIWYFGCTCGGMGAMAPGEEPADALEPTDPATRQPLSEEQLAKIAKAMIWQKDQIKSLTDQLAALKAPQSKT